MAQHTPVQPDQEEIARAQHMWGSFTWIMTASIIAVIVSVVLMAVGFFAIWR